MTHLQRIAQQRAMMRIAEGQIAAVSEMFGVEDNPGGRSHEDFEKWDAKVREFMTWVWDESPIA